MKYKQIKCAICHNIKRHGGRGICINCYGQLKRRNELDKYPRILAMPNSDKPCTNCSKYNRIYAFGLCKKCYSKLPKWKDYHATAERKRRKENQDEYNKKERERNIRRKEQRHIYVKKYYAENKNRLCEYQVKWRKENQEQYKQYMRDARARRNNADGKTTLKQWLMIVDYYCSNKKCISCGKLYNNEIQRDKITVDHIVPINKNGTNWPDNLQPICYSCNASKSDNIIIDYRWDKGKYAKSLMEQI